MQDDAPVAPAPKHFLGVLDPALWMLTRLIARGGFRNLRKQLSKPTGILMFLVLAMCFAGGILPSLVMSLQNDSPLKSVAAPIQKLMPLGLLVMAIFAMVSGVGKTLIELRPAELSFVLAGPFSDRQILTYRLVTLGLNLIPMTLFGAVFLSPYSPSVIRSMLVGLMVFSFLSFLNVLACLLEAKVPSRWMLAARIAIVIVFGITLGMPLVRILTSGELKSVVEIADQVHRDPAISFCMRPFLGFALPLDRSASLIDCLLGMIVPLALVGTCIAGCYGLNVGFTELAAEGIARRETRLSNWQRGGKARLNTRARKIRGTLPDFPFFGGIGPVAWSQCLMVFRSSGNLLTICLVLSIALANADWIYLNKTNFLKPEFRAMAPLIAAGVSCYIGFLAFVTHPIGFAAPSALMMWYRQMPIASWRISLGVVLGGCTHLWAIRVLIAIPAIAITTRPLTDSASILLAGMAFDLIAFAGINLIAANTSLRFIPSGPPDALHGGRVMIMMILFFFSLFPSLIVASILGGIVGWLTKLQWPPTALAAGIGLLLFFPIQILLISWGFSRREEKVA